MPTQFNLQQLFAALVLAATALFLISQRLGGRARRAAMFGAIAIYALLVGAALVYVGLWLLGLTGGR